MNIVERQTRFQKIELRQHPFLKDEVVLYLDSAWQFDSSTEFRYHESIMTIPMAASPSVDRVLICGGGDGLAVREALKFPESMITLCEMDDQMVKLFQEYKGYNNGSLVDYPHRVNLEIGDAVSYVDSLPDGHYYDFIALDFPSPTIQNIRKHYENLFSPEILAKFLRVLHPERGVLSAQVSIRMPLFTKYVAYLHSLGYYVYNFDTYYSVKGNHDSFLVASKTRLSQERQLPSNLRFATDEHIESAFHERQMITKDDVNHFRLFGHLHKIEWDH